MIRWKLFLKKYDINLTYVSGKTNVLAGCFLRLLRIDRPSLGKKEGKGKIRDFKKLVVPKDDEDVFMSTGKEVPILLPSVCHNEDVDIIELFINLPALSEMTCPLIVTNIQQHQIGDQRLVQAASISCCCFLLAVLLVTFGTFGEVDFFRMNHLGVIY